MDNVTKKEQEIIGILEKNPFIEQEDIARLMGTSRSSVAGHLARLIKKGVLQRGYILNKEKEEIAIIGGANIDLKGTVQGSFQYGSSNPGDVFKAAGGVARNIAENLGKLQLQPTLYTVVGEDAEGDWLIDYSHQSGVNVQYVERVSGERTGLYLSILDSKKEQIGSIADMKVMEKLDKAYLMKIYSKLQTAKIAFVDTNLPKETLVTLLEWLKYRSIPIIIDPVSVIKTEKLKGLLDNVFLITPNKEEAEALVGISIETEEDLQAAAAYLFKQGVKQLIITLGDKGTFIASDKEHVFLPSPKVDVKDSTGAGDAFAAGVIYGLNKGESLFDACKYGHALAGITLEREESVAVDLRVSLLENRKKEIFQ